MRTNAVPLGYALGKLMPTNLDGNVFVINQQSIKNPKGRSTTCTVNTNYDGILVGPIALQLIPIGMSKSINQLYDLLALRSGLPHIHSPLNHVVQLKPSVPTIS